MSTRRNKNNRNKRSRSRNRNYTPSIIETSNEIYEDLKQEEDNCLNGCKGFGIHFFIRYLIKRGLILSKDTDKYVKELLNIERNMYHSITNQNTYQLSRLNLPASFLSQMSSDDFDEMTNNKIIFGCIHRKEEGHRVPMAIHTFILSNGTTIYNSWTTDTSINCDDLDIYDSTYTYQEDDDDCSRKMIIMSPKKVKSNNTFVKLHELTQIPDIRLLTQLFGIKESNLIGLGNKSSKNMDLHTRLVQEDIQTVLKGFVGSDILFLGI
jgi:hypothetical protein